MSAQKSQGEESSDISLPNELWIRSFAYLDQRDLFRLCRVNCNFLAIASSDSLWEPVCHRCWKGKQNVQRFYSNGGNYNDGSGRTTYDLIREFSRSRNHISQIAASMPLALNMVHTMETPFHREPTSWKEGFIMAEIDSHRCLLTREEMIYYHWKLVYNGSPSLTGLRQFNADGTYNSPYMPQCEWTIYIDERYGQLVSFAGLSLSVERDVKTWGWIIGKGARTVYYSVEGE